MASAQLPGVARPAGMCDRLNFVLHVFHIVPNPFGFVAGMQAALQPGVMGRDPGGAGVLVALEGLNAAQCKHEPSGRGDEICADG